MFEKRFKFCFGSGTKRGKQKLKELNVSLSFDFKTLSHESKQLVAFLWVLEFANKMGILFKLGDWKLVFIGSYQSQKGSWIMLFKMGVGFFDLSENQLINVLASRQNAVDFFQHKHILREFLK